MPNASYPHGVEGLLYIGSINAVDVSPRGLGWAGMDGVGAGYGSGSGGRARG